MRSPIRSAAVLTLVLCTVACAAPGVESRPRMTTDEFLQESGVLAGVDPAVAERFRKQVQRAVDRLGAMSRDAGFDDDEQMRELAVELVAHCLAGNAEPQASFAAGWASLIMGWAMPRDVVADGLAQAICTGDDPFPLSDPSNDLARYAYRQQGPHNEPDLEYMTAKLGKAKAADREKLIAHLVAYAPSRAFRQLFGVRRADTIDVAFLSWFDRRLQEAIWAQSHGIDLAPDFARQLEADFDTLLGHEVWWVRLYALELMSDLPGLRNPTRMARFKDEPMQLIRRRARALMGSW